jgi:peptidoglycan hydrolase-like protein with peptidoglycan-binding domain
MINKLEDVITLTNGVVRPALLPEDGSDAFAPQAAPPPASPRDLGVTADVKDVQRRLVELGYVSARITGVWGPLSKQALRSFKEVNGLEADATWDRRSEEALFAAGAKPAPAYVGVWATDAKACSAARGQNGLLQTVVDLDGAKAGDASCSFKKKEGGEGRWRMVAACSNGPDRWTANIQLSIKDGRLTWTSERGTQAYSRCEPSRA